MTGDERRALATLWYDLPPNREWWQVTKAFGQLSVEGAITFNGSLMDLCADVRFRSRNFSIFDLLVQRVLENKLLGVTE